MTTEIQTQDQNQLTLFTLLTPKQEAYKATVIKFTNENAQNRYNREKQIADVLESNGFGDNYKFNAEIIKITKLINVGSYEDKIIVEIEVDECPGGTYLIYNRYDKYKNEITTVNCSVIESKGKLTCYELQDYSSRLLKPSTLLNKIREANLKANRDFEDASLKKSIIDYTVDKYSKLYPNATVSKDIISERDYKNRYILFEIVRIKFKNGSYITMKIGHGFDKEYINSKYNVIEAKASLRDLLDSYNNQ